MKRIEHEIVTFGNVNIKSLLSTEEQRTFYSMLFSRILELYHLNQKKEMEVNKN